jgi:hypothetical protein
MLLKQKMKALQKVFSILLIISMASISLKAQTSPDVTSIIAGYPYYSLQNDQKLN